MVPASKSDRKSSQRFIEPTRYSTFCANQSEFWVSISSSPSLVRIAFEIRRTIVELNNMRNTVISILVFTCVACGKNRVNQPVKSWEFVPVEHEESKEPEFEYYGAAANAVAESLPTRQTACDVWEYRILLERLSTLQYDGETIVEIPTLNARFECFFTSAVSTRAERRTWHFDELSFTCTSGTLGLYIRESADDPALAIFRDGSTRPETIEFLFNGERRDFRISNSTWEISGQNCEGGRLR